MQQQTVERKAKNAQVARRLVVFALYFNAALVLTALCEIAATGAQGLGVTLLLALVVNVPVAWYAFSQDVPFVWGCQHTFNKVCRGLGGNFTYEGFSLGNSIREGLKAKPGQYVGNQTKKVYPTLRSVTGTREAWEGLVKPNPGQDIDDFTKNADSFALAYHAPFCSFEVAHKGLIRIRVGSVPVPAPYAFTGHLHASQANNQQPALQQAVQPPQTLQAQFKQPVSKQTLSLDEVPPGVLRAVDDFAYRRGLPAASPVYAHNQQAPDVSRELELLRGVPMARDLTGRVCRIPIESNHWFIAARTGGGKGSWIWGLILGLIPAWRAGLVKFYGIDPKLIELSMGRDFFEHYANDDQSSVELMEKAVDEMHARGRAMQGISRKFTPSVDTPLGTITNFAHGDRGRG